jgi:hypothetical protein
VVGASTVRGESAEAADLGFEEVVTGSIPVSEGGGLVEQGVQGQVQASGQQGLETGEQGGPGQQQV